MDEGPIFDPFPALQMSLVAAGLVLESSLLVGIVIFSNDGPNDLAHCRSVATAGASSVGFRSHHTPSQEVKAFKAGVVSCEMGTEPRDQDRDPFPPLAPQVSRTKRPGP
eukprot:1809671-Amphidinium_carterae.1